MSEIVINARPVNSSYELPEYYLSGLLPVGTGHVPNETDVNIAGIRFKFEPFVQEVRVWAADAYGRYNNLLATFTPDLQVDLENFKIYTALSRRVTDYALEVVLDSAFRGSYDFTDPANPTPKQFTVPAITIRTEPHDPSLAHKTVTVRQRLSESTPALALQKMVSLDMLEFHDSGAMYMNHVIQYVLNRPPAPLFKKRLLPAV